MDLVVEVYRLTEKFPKTEIYGLTSQMRRSAVSIPSNIAEGSKRKTNKDFCHFLVISMGSASELETQIKIAKRLHLGDSTDYNKADVLLTEVLKMMSKLIASL